MYIENWDQTADTVLFVCLFWLKDCFMNNLNIEQACSGTCHVHLFCLYSFVSFFHLKSSEPIAMSFTLSENMVFNWLYNIHCMGLTITFWTIYLFPKASSTLRGEDFLRGIYSSLSSVCLKSC